MQPVPYRKKIVWPLQMYNKREIVLTCQNRSNDKQTNTHVDKLNFTQQGPWWGRSNESALYWTVTIAAKSSAPDIQLSASW